MKKKVLAFFLCMILVMSGLAGCSKKETTESKTSENESKKSTVVFATSEADSKNWQPSVVNNGAIISVMLQFYETLIAWGNDGEMYPLLAEDYEFIENDDGTYKLHITLHDGIKTSDGNPVTTEDVLWSFQWASEQAEFIKHTTWIDFDKTQIIDELNMEFGIKEMNYYILNDLSRIAITSKKSFEESGDNLMSLPVGTGPYVMTEYTPDVEFILEKNENYWNKDTQREYQLQNVDRIITKFITEDSQRTIELESGSVDIIMGTPFTEIDHYEESEEFENYIWDSPETYCVYYNSSEGAICDNVTLRQALSYGIDNKAVVQTLFNGISHPAVSVVGVSNTEYDDSYETRESVYSYDPEKAKELLKEAGYGEGGLKLRLLTDNSAKYAPLAEVIQGQLMQIGVECEIVTVDASTLMTVMFEPDQWDICVNGYAAKGSILFYFNNQLNAQKNIRGFWNDEKFQTILQNALIDGNEEDTAELIELFDEQVPVYPLYNLSKVFTYREGIEGFNVCDDGYVYAGNFEYSEDADWLYD